jgi:hypothetical protein
MVQYGAVKSSKVATKKPADVSSYIHVPRPFSLLLMFVGFSLGSFIIASPGLLMRNHQSYQGGKGQLSDC